MALEWLIATAAAVIGGAGGVYVLYRAWHERRRLALTLIGAFQPDPSKVTTNASIRILNPNSDPVLVEGAGFLFKSGRRVEYDNNAEGHSGTQRLEHRLQPHDVMTLSIDLLLLLPDTNDGDTLAAAYVEWAGQRPGVPMGDWHPLALYYRERLAELQAGGEVTLADWQVPPELRRPGVHSYLLDRNDRLVGPEALP